ncbi:hypothetical protein [Amycolatopsis sp. NBC_01480]|uniref:hypothetical protein n=1 Tax=Amycolatopsis sp. NBC_01480 TaxID=2903562 RepID=UPI002E2E23C2|nr:hypothetical protein [Amycolatopsis sp. NBC_01480]
MFDTTTQSLQELLDDTNNAVGGILACLEWAEDEIQAAMRRHPDAEDTLWHSNILLCPTDHLRLTTEWVFRSHCRELLERVASGDDTRPATDAEICCATLVIATRIPIRSAAFGMQMRLWHRAFPGKEVMQADKIAHYEALFGNEMLDLEREARAKLAVQNRSLGAVTCAGVHHGVKVDCTYALLPTVGRSDTATQTG